VNLSEATFVDAISEECCRDRVESEAESVAGELDPLDLRASASMLSGKMCQLFPRTMRQRLANLSAGKTPGRSFPRSERAFPTNLVFPLSVFLPFAFLPYQSELRHSSRVFSDSRALTPRRCVPTKTV
jgi:hypothetical protein